MTIENEIMALSRIKHELSCDMLLEKGKPKQTSPSRGNT